MARPKRPPIVFGRRDARFQRERERVLTLPEPGDWERNPMLVGVSPGLDGSYQIACVYIYEDGGGLWLLQEWTIGDEAREQLVEVNGQLNGGLAAGMRVRTDRDHALGDREGARYWRLLADRIAYYDCRFSKRQYAEQYRVQAERFAQASMPVAEEDRSA